MRSYFTDWYQAAGIGLDGNALKTRWQAVEELEKKLSLTQACGTLRFVLGLRLSDANFQLELAEKVHAIDASFSPHHGTLELGIIGAAMLRLFFERTPQGILNQLAMSTACANWQGLAMWQLPHQHDLIKIALGYLEKQAVRLRTPNELNFTASEKEELSLTEAIQALLNPIGWQQHQARFEEPFNLLTEMIKTQNKTISQIEYKLKIQREENNILWWLMGQSSSDLGIHFSALPVGAAAIVCGRELEELTTIIPGPRSAPAVLRQMLQVASNAGETKSNSQAGTGKIAAAVTLKDAVNQTPVDWRTSVIEKIDLDGISDFCPVHAAIKQSAEAADAKKWVAVYDASAPLKATQKFLPLDLAMQAYQEAQLIYLAGEEE